MSSKPIYIDIPELISGKVHAVEVAEDIAALDVFSDETELAERPEKTMPSFNIEIKIRHWQK